MIPIESVLTFPCIYRSLLLLRFSWRLRPRPAAQKTVTPERTAKPAITDLVAAGDVEIQKWRGEYHPVTPIKPFSR